MFVLLCSFALLVSRNHLFQNMLVHHLLQSATQPSSLKTYHTTLFNLLKVPTQPLKSTKKNRLKMNRTVFRMLASSYKLHKFTSCFPKLHRHEYANITKKLCSWEYKQWNIADIIDIIIVMICVFTVNIIIVMICRGQFLAARDRARKTKHASSATRPIRPRHSTSQSALTFQSNTRTKDDVGNNYTQ